MNDIHNLDAETIRLEVERYRLMKGWSQEKFATEVSEATKLPISTATISKLEAKKTNPSKITMSKIARFLWPHLHLEPK